MYASLQLKPGQLTLDQLRAIYQSQSPFELDPAARDVVDASTRTVDDIIANQRTVYGINTGFGLLARTSIATESLAKLQRNLLLSHCTGTGPLLDDASVGLIMALKVGSLARGFSGIRWEVIQALSKLYAARVYPCIPSQGSVGASGDLAPLAHMSAVLIGIGRVRHEGREMDAVEGLAIAGLEPMVLGPKEGLALINGTQVSTALALRGLFACEKLFSAAVVAGSLSVEALKGSDVPFDPRIQAVRGQPGQIDVALFYPTAGHERDSRIPSRLRPGAGPVFAALPAAGDGACLDHMRLPPGCFCVKPTPSRITRWCSVPTVMCSPAATSTLNPSPWPPMYWPWPFQKSVRCPSAGSPNWLIRHSRACRPSWCAKAG